MDIDCTLVNVMALPGKDSKHFKETHNNKNSASIFKFSFNEQSLNKIVDGFYNQYDRIFGRRK